MQGEKRVVDLRRHDRLANEHQFQAQRHAEEDGQHQPEENSPEIHQGQPFMIVGEQPGFDSGQPGR